MNGFTHKRVYRDNPNQLLGRFSLSKNSTAAPGIHTGILAAADKAVDK